MRANTAHCTHPTTCPQYTRLHMRLRVTRAACRFQEWGPNASDMLDPDKETMVLCHHGVRSMRAALFLASQGFQDVKNIEGGIDAYSRQVDSSVPIY